MVAWQQTVIGRLQLVSGIMNATKYIDVLEKKMLPGALSLISDEKWVFHDDNAPCIVPKNGSTGTEPIKLSK